MSTRMAVGLGIKGFLRRVIWEGPLDQERVLVCLRSDLHRRLE